MKLYINIDNENYITSIAFSDIPGTIPTDYEVEDFSTSSAIITDGFHKFIDGKIVKVDTISEAEVQRKKEALRRFREETCFPIINRGTLWYNKLTEEQKSELSKWYQDWLDSTETLEEPKKPKWLK